MSPQKPPIAFASNEPLSTEVLAAHDPPRYPRGSRWNAPLTLGWEKGAKAAEQLGLTSVGALLEHLPASRRESRTIAELAIGETATVVVEVRTITSRPVRRRGMRPIVEAVVRDGTGTMQATFFNQPWLATKYTAGTRLVLHGKFEARNRYRVQSHALTRESAGGGVSGGPARGGGGNGGGNGGDGSSAARGETDATAGVGGQAEVVAHYPATEGLSSTQILALVREHISAAHDTVEPLPAQLRDREGFPDRAAALVAAHFGDSDVGRQRLAFEEFILLELELLRRRARRAQGQRAPSLPPPKDLTQRWLENVLPFDPTSDQANAMAVIDEDLQRDHPMQRLIMGEVGSGKTVVALYTMLRAVEDGAQAALMAPTETLAEQHFATLQRLMPEEMIGIGLLTGSTPAGRRADLLAKLASGELALLVGTHALIEDPVIFDRLAVAVIDEQHRFGVNQRRALDEKGVRRDSVLFAPHILHMTATPIPRTLALTAYGDLDITTLHELPAGRRPILTYVASSDRERVRAYERIREELRAGRQAFVVCPLVEESEELQARAATEEFERLSRSELADFRVVLMHGQMRPKEKQAAMKLFADGEADVLVATSVIEVGIDVPNATVMLIENAERYGIAQLHQLRGRIGRGPYDSVCLLFGPKESPRLKALAEHSDGFALAEVDLELRGEGELLGTRQSGLAQFRFGQLPEDFALLERARYYADEILKEDPELVSLEHQLLSQALDAAYGGDSLTPIAA